jgi:peptidyl-prolyl cis-trans isomerase D
MLEFIRERAQGWLAKLILALVTIPFALWGVDSYLRHSGAGDNIATVDGHGITSQEFARSLREQQDVLRKRLGASFDPALLETVDAKHAVLENLINQRLLADEAGRQGLLVSDARLAGIIAQVPAFQEDGKFSAERYEAMLRSQNMTPAIFEARVRREMSSQQLLNAISSNVLVSHAVTDRLISIAEQQREVSQAVIATEQFMGQVKIDQAAVKAYYDAHLKEFAVPEQVRLQYVVLSQDALVPQMQASEEEIAQYYAEHKNQYIEPEERKASHILITLAPNASQADVAAARSKANDILKQAIQNPASFGELAKKYSQDPGSAAHGGDLGFFARGAMVKDFDDTVFQMKDGEIRGPVRSEFGFHIIKLTGIKPGKTVPLSQVHDEIALAVEKRKAARKYIDAAETFSNMVYEQSNSLKPVAEALKLSIQTSPWVNRQGGVEGVAGNPKLLKAVFSDDILKNGRNTEAVEVAPNTLVSARLIEHKPATTKPYAEVAAAISQKLQRDAAAKLAVQKGQELLAELKQGKTPSVAWAAAQTITRQHAQGMSGEVISQAYKADVNKLPAFTGIETPQGYTLLRISRVIDATGVDDAKRRAYQQELAKLAGNEVTTAYLASLRADASIKIKQDALKAQQ